MFISLLSMFGGGLLRCLPEIIGFFNKKADNAHELNMLNVQLELEKTKQASQAAQNTATELLEELKATSEALSAQMTQISIPITGVRLLDAVDGFMATLANVLNMLVRPLTAYYFLTLYGAYKAALLAVALQQVSIWQAILQVYNPDDAAMLYGILGFYFVGRSFDKQK